MIFLDYAGIAPCHEQSVRAMNRADLGSGHEDEIYHLAARLLGVTSDCISYHNSASHAWMRIISSIEWEEGDNVIVTETEYVSFVMTWLRLKEAHKLKIHVVKLNQNGTPCIEHLKCVLDKIKKCKYAGLVSIATHDGMIQDVNGMTAMVKHHDVNTLVLVDAAQAVGHIKVNMSDIGCDAIITTGRKYLQGPRGTGLAATSQRLRDRLSMKYLDVRALDWVKQDISSLRRDARILEEWEHSPMLKRGLCKAVELTLRKDLTEVQRAIQSKTLRLMEELGLSYESNNARQFLCIPLEKFRCVDKIRNLSDYGIKFSIIEPILNPLLIRPSSSLGVMRLSPCEDTSEDDILRAARLIQPLLQ